MNYFVNTESILDLECNIPIQQSSLEHMLPAHKQKVRTIDSNERKIYINNTRYLGLDQANVIFFPITRIDILFWKNIQESDASA